MTLKLKVVLGPELLKRPRVSWSFWSVSFEDSKMYVIFLAGFPVIFQFAPSAQIVGNMQM